MFTDFPELTRGPHEERFRALDRFLREFLRKYEWENEALRREIEELKKNDNKEG